MKIINKTIEVIAHHTEDFKVIPLRMKVRDKNDGFQTYKIDRIIYSKDDKWAGQKYTRYDCQGLIKGKEKRYELRYFYEKRQWVLYKI